MRLPAALAVSLSAATLALPISAQTLELDVIGGSMPGVLAMDVYPETYPFEFFIVIPSTMPGPTFLSWFDPNDSRTLNVGLDLLSLAWLGFAEPDGHFRVALPIVPEPSFIDTPIYAQAGTLVFTPTLFDRISNPTAFRWANSGTFRDRAISMASPRVFGTALPRPDRKWMVAGGGGGALLAQVGFDTTDVYDPVADTFTPGPNLTTPRSMHTATLLPNGRWLLAGGVNASNDPQPSCEVYDPTTDTFSAVASMATPRMGHTATLLNNGKVLVSGGLQALTVVPTQLSAIHDITNTAEVYDPVADTWTAVPNLSTPRAGHVAILRPDGKVLLAGGLSWDNVIVIGWLPAVRRSCDLYDPIANTMTSAPQMATARSLIDPIDLGGNRWLVAGGITALTLTNPGTPTATAEIYDAALNTWTTVGSMAAARGNQRGWAIGGGKFLLAGGASGSVLSPTPLATTEIFSTATNTFSAGPAMTSPRAGAAALFTPYGQMHLFGGASSGGPVTAATEWYFF